MKRKCIHYEKCRNPVSQCNSQCERSKCAERDFGMYETTKHGVTEPAEMTKYGWKVAWSKWFQNDADLDAIGRKIE